MHYHFIGAGVISETLREDFSNSTLIADRISQFILDSDLKVVSHETISFENEGRTYIWILAESHLVVHVWWSEEFATIDLHVCDYESSNLDRAQRLKASLSDYCFDHTEERWHEFTLPRPRPNLPG